MIEREWTQSLLNICENLLMANKNYLDFVLSLVAKDIPYPLQALVIALLAGQTNEEIKL